MVFTQETLLLPGFSEGVLERPGITLKPEQVNQESGLAGGEGVS